MKVNGREMDLDRIRILELLDRLELDSSRLVVEVNGQIIQKDQYDLLLKRGDRIELVSFVGGG